MEVTDTSFEKKEKELTETIQEFNFGLKVVQKKKQYSLCIITVELYYLAVLQSIYKIIFELFLDALTPNDKNSKNVFYSKKKSKSQLSCVSKFHSPVCQKFLMKHPPKYFPLQYTIDLHADSLKKNIGRIQAHK